MKIEKRGPDSYRVRKMYKGQMYTVAFDHKPTQKEAMLEMAKELPCRPWLRSWIRFRKSTRA